MLDFQCIQVMASTTTTTNNSTNNVPTTTTSPDSRSLHGDPIAWLQSRIGSYDVAHDLEPLVQKSVLKGLKHVPKRSGRIKTELIDLGECHRENLSRDLAIAN